MLTSAALRARLLNEADVSEAIQHARKGIAQPEGRSASGTEEYC